MVGHKLLIKSFKALVENERLAHGYLFYGSDGVGKKTFAVSFANFLENKKFDPVKLPDGDHGAPVLGDLLLVEPNEKKTIGIDGARRVKEFLYMKPNASSKRTVVIDEAEFLTTEAQNALLKITEEPPESARLILIARSPEIFTATLGSRLQKVYFSAAEVLEVEGWLKDQGVANAGEVAKKSLGKPGLAMRMLQDGKFQTTSKLAEKFLKTSGSTRKDFLKELLEPEDFDILSFLDCLILNLATRIRIDTPILEIRKVSQKGYPNFSTGQANIHIIQKEIRLWHRVLKLREDFSNFPLNPKLQLLNL